MYRRQADSHTTIGFWQGLGWVLAGTLAAAITVVLAAAFNHLIIVGAVLAAVLGLYRDRRLPGGYRGARRQLAPAS